ncbi:hypothetical protein LTR94_034361, partial [Friedmanniomyces endolithicus]
RRARDIVAGTIRLLSAAFARNCPGRRDIHGDIARKRSDTGSGANARPIAAGQISRPASGATV